MVQLQKPIDLSEEDADDLYGIFRTNIRDNMTMKKISLTKSWKNVTTCRSCAKTYFDYKQFARDLFMCDYWFDDGFVFRAA